MRLSHTLAATPAAKPHDAFDRDDFDAIQYINEMFPNGATISWQRLSWQVFIRNPQSAAILAAIPLVDRCKRTQISLTAKKHTVD